MKWDFRSRTTSNRYPTLQFYESTYITSDVSNFCFDQWGRYSPTRRRVSTRSNKNLEPRTRTVINLNAYFIWGKPHLLLSYNVKYSYVANGSIGIKTTLFDIKTNLYYPARCFDNPHFRAIVTWNWIYTSTYGFETDFIVHW